MNLSKIQLIGLDLDGTTLSENKTMTPRVKQAIQTAIQNGIIVMPATGRQLEGIPAEFLEIPGVRYALTANGAMIYDLQEKEILYSDYFTPELAMEIVKYLKDKEIMVTLYQDGNGYTQNLDFSGFEEIISPNLIEYMRSTRKEVEDLETLIQKNGQRLEKFSILFKDPKLRAKTLEELAARGDNCTTSSVKMNLEINTLTANKGSALVALAEKLGIPQSNIMAVGDSGNDIEMLKAVGIGVAMGNASPEVKKVADIVTEDCEHDGVAKIIEQVLREKMQANT